MQASNDTLRRLRLRTLRNTFVCCGVALLFTVVRPHVAQATDGLEPIGVSQQAIGRGGADVAVGDTPLSQIDNPASLTHFQNWRMDGMVDLAIVYAPWRGVYETAYSERQLIPLGNMGLTIPVNDRWTMGIALHSKAGLGTKFRMRHLMIPFMDRDVGSDLKVMDPQFNVGFKVNDKLSIGAGLVGEVATAKFSTVLGPADIEFGRGYSYGLGFHLGAEYKIRDDVTLGLAYRSPTWGSDLQGGKGKASLFGLVPINLGQVSIEDFHLAQKVTFGAAWDVTKKLKLAGEVRWFNYNHTTFNHTTIAIDGPVNIDYPFPLGYQDLWAFMVGGDYKLTQNWIASAGYHFCTSPVARANVLPMGSTTWQHHMSIGLRYETPKWWAGCGYTIAFPTWLRGSGWSKIPLGFDYGRAEMTQLENAIVLGGGYTFK